MVAQPYEIDYTLRATENKLREDMFLLYSIGYLIL